MQEVREDLAAEAALRVEELVREVAPDDLFAVRELRDRLVDDVVAPAAGVSASAPRGKIEVRMTRAFGCFSAMTRRISRMPQIVSIGVSFSNGKCPELFVPIMRRITFAS